MFKFQFKTNKSEANLINIKFDLVGYSYMMTTFLVAWSFVSFMITLLYPAEFAVTSVQVMFYVSVILTTLYTIIENRKELFGFVRSEFGKIKAKRSAKKSNNGKNFKHNTSPFTNKSEEYKVTSMEDCDSLLNECVMDRALENEFSKQESMSVNDNS